MNFKSIEEDSDLRKNKIFSFICVIQKLVWQFVFLNLCGSYSKPGQFGTEPYFVVVVLFHSKPKIGNISRLTLIANTDVRWYACEYDRMIDFDL